MKALIIASGPSLTEADVESTRGLFDCTIVINDNYKICPWADILYACDHKWWVHHKGVEGFKGRKITPFSITAKQFNLEHFPAQNGIFSEDRISFGNNSGHQAITLAYLLRFREIYLLGYDCKATKSSHWFGDHPPNLFIKSDYGYWADQFRLLDEELRRRSVRVVNLSRDTALKFEKMDLSCITQATNQ